MAAAEASGPLAGWQAKRSKLVPLASIAVTHAVVFYLLQSGMLHQVAHAALPSVVNVMFVAPPPAPPVAGSSAIPKTVELSQPAAYVPPLPAIASAAPAVVAKATAITVAQAPAEPAPAAAIAAPAAPVAEAPATVAVAASPRTVSGVAYVRAPQPIYPALSRRLGETGVVLLRILIDTNGQPEQVLVQKSSGFSSLDEAGRQAGLRAVFKPYMEDGKPVAVFVLVPLNFQLS
jgi:protein TonB